MIFTINKFYANLTDGEFSVRKSLWDVPTYIFYELVFGLILLVSIVFFIIPGVFVFYFLCFVPIVSILLDDDEEGIIGKTVKIIKKDFKVYTMLLIPFVLLNLIDLVFDKLILYISNNAYLGFSVRYVVTFAGLVSLGALISFLSQTYYGVSKDISAL